MFRSCRSEMLLGCLVTRVKTSEILYYKYKSSRTVCCEYLCELIHSLSAGQTVYALEYPLYSR